MFPQHRVNVGRFRDQPAAGKAINLFLCLLDGVVARSLPPALRCLGGRPWARFRGRQAHKLGHSKKLWCLVESWPFLVALRRSDQGFSDTLLF